ncbi:ABC transporter substrate-binding protein [Rhodocyclus purpureus]|uniref:ABC transporter substrate-binding protein n=1 Tax=Rhodocyclus purpureus TaxID=1067 RepID=UPI00191406DD|nr:ABC transporter substrate-binding protein [Rhodocyclus purpureus]MBK5914199.1 ABC transporter substrate-binding protein [Rhodocyclus purpureus]
MTMKVPTPLLHWMLGCLLCLLCGVATASGPLKKASFIPLWLPQAQFAGYYMAAEKGIYLKHGIDLTIIDGGPGRSPAEYLRDGRADFAAMWLTTALQRRDEGLPLVHVAQVVQQSSMLLVARKDSGIRTLADLDGRKVGLWGGDFDIPPRSVFDQHRLKVKPVQQSGTVNLFLRGGVAAASAMWYNEYHSILSAGMDEDELTVFPLRDHGANYPEDGLYALQETVARDPQLVDAFVRASLEGWEYAFAHPEETLDVMLRVIKEAHLPANRMHQRWMLTRMQALMRPTGGQDGVGELKRKDYQVVAQELRRRGLVREALDYEVFVKAGRALP